MGARAVIGDWYFTHEDDVRFEVVALDEESGTIDVQYFDGSIGEFDLETWREMDVSPCAAPEDSSGPYEMSFDEFDDTDESACASIDEFGEEGFYIINDSDFERWSGHF